MMLVFAASTGFWEGIAMPTKASNTKANPSQKVFEWGVVRRCSRPPRWSSLSIKAVSVLRKRAIGFRINLNIFLVVKRLTLPERVNKGLTQPLTS